MRLYDTFGRPTPMTYDEMLTMFSNRVTVSFLALVAVAFFALDPHKFRPVMPDMLALLLWLFSVAFVAILKLVDFALVAVLTSRFNIRIYLPLLSAFEFLLTILVAERLGVVLSGGAWEPTILDSYFYYVITLLLIETFYIRFVIPDILRQAEEARPPAVAMPPVSEDSISVAGRTLLLQNISHVVSEEHYVRVVLRNEQIVHRARLADLVGQTRPEDGFQPHRSWWICRHAQPKLLKDGTKPRILLPGEVEVPVARARIKAVQAWFDRHATW